MHALRRPRTWWTARGAGGPSSSRFFRGFAGGALGGPLNARGAARLHTPRAVAALQQLLSPSAAADAGSLCLFLARSLAAAAATAGFEGLWVLCCPLTVWGHAWAFAAAAVAAAAVAAAAGACGAAAVVPYFRILLLLVLLLLPPSLVETSLLPLLLLLLSLVSGAFLRGQCEAFILCCSAWIVHTPQAAALLTHQPRADHAAAEAAMCCCCCSSSKGSSSFVAPAAAELQQVACWDGRGDTQQTGGPLPLLQPEDVVSGLGDAFRCLARGFTSAQAVVCRMYSPNRLGPETLQLAARVLPALVLRPLLGFSEGCTRALQGARNQLRPSAREERLAVVRHPRTDVGLIPSDEDDDMLIA
ncbi:hypothetical protein Emag_001135 [Eimeria magna]